MTLPRRTPKPPPQTTVPSGTKSRAAGGFSFDAGGFMVADYLRAHVVDIDSISPDPHNTRKHDDRSIAAIWNSLVQFGQRVPIAVNSKTKFVSAGNGRWIAAKKNGAKFIAAIFYDDAETMNTAWAIADNFTGDLSTWAETELAASVQRLQAANFDMSRIGYEPGDVENLLRQVTPQPNPMPAKSGKVTRDVSVTFSPAQYKHITRAIGTLNQTGLSDAEAITEMAKKFVRP